MKAKLFTLTLLSVFANQIALGTITINWGTPSVGTNHVLRSDGTSESNPGFTWSIGYFNDGFVPSGSNASTWGANWNSIASDTYGLEGIFYRAGGSTTLPNGHASEGKNIYMFAYNDLNNMGTENGEAILFRDETWVMPEINDSTSQVPSWNVDENVGTETGLQMVWGAVARTVGSYNTGDTNDANWRWTQGTTTRDATSSFTAQFASFVPEPSSTILLLFGAASVAMRRRRG